MEAFLFGEDRAPSPLRIDELAEDAKRLDGNPRPLGLLVHRARDRIHHPLGQHAARPVWQRYDHLEWLSLGVMPPNHLHVAAVQGMMAIEDLGVR